MIRAILSVIIGYVALFIWVMATMTGAWFALGSDFAYDLGTYDASTGWSVVSLVLGLIGAVIGGLVTAVAYQMGDATADEAAQAVPVDDLGVWQAASTTQPQAWYSYSLPFVGCAGVLLGGRIRRRSESS